MPASIWLQVSGDADRVLRRIIADLAAEYGTVPFQPHLTVCSIPPGDTAVAAAATDYVRQCGALPLRATKVGISTSTTAPFKAVVIDIDNAPALASFRSELRRITGAPEPEPPHISLFYTIGEHQKPIEWAADQRRLRAIAETCVVRLDAIEFVLDDPVVVAPRGEWTNIRSWRTMQKF
jgi:2'-5' RNA ligase